jgi:cytochrome c oxidase assembly protein subunit 15
MQAVAILSGGASGAARRSGLLLLVAVAAQAALGILTLLRHVPLDLGLMHQGGAAIVLGVAVWHVFATRRADRIGI